ncbi:hypothetical protein [Streptomyces sp. AN091965]|uniref:hypothetical protein n=1 Tax=Streptomyces sp. AN091965 TaxID=2927803 RepID=UPI001F615FEF|nr:hypothetical protein [Streptomyces sp. AN091965]MCI3928862.1 hypothetical protein [Streptomyces sp. AN091965]
MEVFGIVALVFLLVVPSLKKLLNSVAYRIRAQGKAEIIRAEHSGLSPRPVPSGGREQAKRVKGQARG